MALITSCSYLDFPNNAEGNTYEGYDPDIGIVTMSFDKPGKINFFSTATGNEKLNYYLTAKNRMIINKTFLFNNWQITLLDAYAYEDHIILKWKYNENKTYSLILNQITDKT